MKRFDYKLEADLFKKVFPTHRIDNRKEILTIVLETIRYILITEPIDIKTNIKQKLVIYVDDMQRVFYFNNEKYYSVALPFSLKIVNEKVIFNCFETIIDAEIISKIISVLQSDNYVSDSFWDLTEILDEIGNDNYNFGKIFKYLMTYDLGYLRFDNDDNAYQEAIKNHIPNMHPKYHIDINFTNASTYKCGLSKKITQQEFIDIVDNKKDCWFLQKVTSSKH